MPQFIALRTHVLNTVAGPRVYDTDDIETFAECPNRHWLNLDDQPGAEPVELVSEPEQEPEQEQEPVSEQRRGRGRPRKNS